MRDWHRRYSGCMAIRRATGICVTQRLRYHGHRLIFLLQRTLCQPHAPRRQIGYRLPASWLRALSDARLAPALQRLHGDPARNWHLDEGWTCWPSCTS
jgi:hypothetical protein